MVGSTSASAGAQTASRSTAALAAALLIVALIPGIGPANALETVAEPTVVFDGGGFGHGVGLSQYGAKGQALDGRSAEDIVTHYYAGTEVAQTSELPIGVDHVDRPVWVGLQQALTTATVAWSSGDGTICLDPDPDNADAPCASTINVRTGERFTVTWNNPTDTCSFVRTTVDGEAQPLGLTAPDCRMSLSSDGGVLWFEAKGYPEGTIELRRAPGTDTFHVTATLDLETYVAGIAEVPSSWPAAALEAQALAARSFALNRYLAYEKVELRSSGDAGLSDSAKTNCWCHVYDDTRSQVYGGVDAMSAPWVAAAAATAGSVVAYRASGWASYTRSQVIEAYYSSSNAGTSVSNVDAWGSAKQYPYLVAVDDPWSVAESTGNPYATWSLERTADTLAGNLGWDEVVAIRVVENDPALIRFAGTDNGAPVTVDKRGDALRGSAGLLSGQVGAITFPTVPACNGHFATLVGTAGSDELTGTSDADVIVGRGGDDIIVGRGGDDIICGNSGNDQIAGNSGDDLLYGGTGSDTILGGGGLDTIYGGSGGDLVDGGNGADNLNGGKGLDTVYGSGGGDTVTGGGGADLIDGGGGADALYGNAGADQLFGSTNMDRLWGGLGPDLLDGGGADNDECRGGDGIDEATTACETVVSVP